MLQAQARRWKDKNTVDYAQAFDKITALATAALVHGHEDILPGGGRDRLLRELAKLRDARNQVAQDMHLVARAPGDPA